MSILSYFKWTPFVCHNLRLNKQLKSNLILTISIQFKNESLPDTNIIESFSLENGRQKRV